MAIEAQAGKPAFTECLPRAPESAYVARRLVSGALRVWGLEAVEFAAHMVVTELLSNAVAHARWDTVRVVVTRLDELQVEVAVVDRSRKLPRVRCADADDESGRGLALVAALSENQWGADPLRWGKRVWARLSAAEEKPSA